jgi:hypothetical protein
LATHRGAPSWVRLAQGDPWPAERSKVVAMTRDHWGKALRFVASEGWADQDADVVKELLKAAQQLAVAVLDDQVPVQSLRERASAFLAQLSSDLLGQFPRAE